MFDVVAPLVEADHAGIDLFDLQRMNASRRSRSIQSAPSAYRNDTGQIWVRFAI
jgi:hypothetical protein